MQWPSQLSSPQQCEQFTSLWTSLGLSKYMEKVTTFPSLCISKTSLHFKKKLKCSHFNQDINSSHTKQSVNWEEDKDNHIYIYIDLHIPIYTWICLWMGIKSLETFYHGCAHHHAFNLKGRVRLCDERISSILAFETRFLKDLPLQDKSHLRKLHQMEYLSWPYSYWACNIVTEFLFFFIGNVFRAKNSWKKLKWSDWKYKYNIVTNVCYFSVIRVTLIRSWMKDNWMNDKRDGMWMKSPTQSTNL